MAHPTDEPKRGQDWVPARSAPPSEPEREPPADTAPTKALRVVSSDPAGPEADRIGPQRTTLPGDWIPDGLRPLAADAAAQLAEKVKKNRGVRPAPAGSAKRVEGERGAREPTSLASRSKSQDTRGLDPLLDQLHRAGRSLKEAEARVRSAESTAHSAAEAAREAARDSGRASEGAAAAKGHAGAAAARAKAATDRARSAGEGAREAAAAAEQAAARAESAERHASETAEGARTAEKRVSASARSAAEAERRASAAALGAQRSAETASGAEQESRLANELAGKLDRRSCDALERERRLSEELARLSEQAARNAERIAAQQEAIVELHADRTEARLQQVEEGAQRAGPKPHSAPRESSSGPSSAEAKVKGRWLRFVRANVRQSEPDG